MSRRAARAVGDGYLAALTLCCFFRDRNTGDPLDPLVDPVEAKLLGVVLEAVAPDPNDHSSSVGCLLEHLPREDHLLALYPDIERERLSTGTAGSPGLDPWLVNVRVVVKVPC